MNIFQHVIIIIKFKLIHQAPHTPPRTLHSFYQGGWEEV